MFDCWLDPVSHLLLLKSFIVFLISNFSGAFGVTNTTVMTEKFILLLVGMSAPAKDKLKLKRPFTIQLKHFQALLFVSAAARTGAS